MFGLGLRLRGGEVELYLFSAGGGSVAGTASAEGGILFGILFKEFLVAAEAGGSASGLAGVMEGLEGAHRVIGMRAGRVMTFRAGHVIPFASFLVVADAAADSGVRFVVEDHIEVRIAACRFNGDGLFGHSRGFFHVPSLCVPCPDK